MSDFFWGGGAVVDEFIPSGKRFEFQWETIPFPVGNDFFPR